MKVGSVFYFFAVYLFLVLVVVDAASRKRNNLFKAFIIRVLFIHVIGLVASFGASRKVIVTHYNPTNRCPGYPYIDDMNHEFCENCDFINKVTEQPSIKRKYFI